MAAPPTEQHHFFEGPEKLLEVWFKPLNGVSGTVSKHPEPKVGLRSIPLEKLEELLRLVHCTIIGSSHHDYLDSYVLSESSMFVAPYRLILKTCGQTTLLPAVPFLINLAREVGLEEVTELFFSRRSFSRPDLQLHPHRDFADESTFLDGMFPDGRQMTLGPCHEDEWHLYLLNRRLPAEMADRTLEIIMRDLDPTAMAVFFQTDTPRTGADVTKESGIGALFPGAHTDDFLFSPCGYSVNGVLGDGYFTIHVTPQAEFSYVSFETDIPLDSYTALLQNVLTIFRPGQFIATLFSNRVGGFPAQTTFDAPLVGYRRIESAAQDLESYTLNYAAFRLDKTAPASPVLRSAPV